MAPKAKRQYSRDFTPSKRQKRRTLSIGEIPAELQTAYKRRAKQEGVSIRALVLGFLQDWAEGGPARA